MGIYDDLIASKGSGTPYDQLKIVETGAMTTQNLLINAPRDYIEFITKIGFGELGNNNFMLYGGLITPNEIFGETDSHLDGILLFGDDFQGVNTAFNIKDWSVVEIDSTNLGITTINSSFESFIRHKIASIQNK